MKNLKIMKLLRNHQKKKTDKMGKENESYDIY